MVCIHCGGKTKVVNSRRQSRSNQVWRRRQCLDCGAVFSTREGAQHELAWMVRTSGQLEPFSRDKLFMSLYKSCEHRKTALNDAKGLADTVISKLPNYAVNGTISDSDIVRAAQVALNRFDKAASTHYQAFHKA
jgi:transcriptional repressor NrdR